MTVLLFTGDLLRLLSTGDALEDHLDIDLDLDLRLVERLGRGDLLFDLFLLERVLLLLLLLHFRESKSFRRWVRELFGLSSPRFIF